MGRDVGVWMDEREGGGGKGEAREGDARKSDIEGSGPLPRGLALGQEGLGGLCKPLEGPIPADLA